MIKASPLVKLKLPPDTLYKISVSLKLPLAVLKAVLLNAPAVVFAVTALLVIPNPVRLPPLVGAMEMTLPFVEEPLKYANKSLLSAIVPFGSKK